MILMEKYVPHFLGNRPLGLGSTSLTYTVKKNNLNLRIKLRILRLMQMQPQVCQTFLCIFLVQKADICRYIGSSCNRLGFYVKIQIIFVWDSVMCEAAFLNTIVY